MTSIVIHKSFFYLGTFALLLGGLVLGSGIGVKYGIWAFSPFIPLNAQNIVIEIDNYAWISIILALIVIGIGLFSLNYGMRTEVVTLTKVEGKFFCRYCGKENKPDAVYCEGCGKKF